MSPLPPCILPDSTVAQAMDTMRESHANEVLVVHDSPSRQQVLGIFTESDVVATIVEHGPGALSIPVSKVMTTPVRTVDSDEDLLHSIRILHALGVRRLPVMERDRAVGLLTLADAIAAQQVQLEQLEQLNEELAEQAHCDALTGLANRRSFDEVLARDIARLERSGQPMALLIADIDHFKKINDSYGHPTGDFVLRRLAALFRASLRRCDVVARVGGEEFAVVLSVGSRGEVRAVAEKLRRLVERTEFDDGNRRIPVTISLGGALLTATGNADALFAKADRALYRAKQMGRNRVEIADAQHDGSP